MAGKLGRALVLLVLLAAALITQAPLAVFLLAFALVLLVLLRLDAAYPVSYTHLTLPTKRIV